MRLLLLSVVLAGIAGGQSRTAEPRAEGWEFVENGRVPGEHVERLHIVVNSPLKLVGEASGGGIFYSIERVVRAGGERIAAGFKLLTRVKDGWTILSLESPVAPFRTALRLSVPKSVRELKIEARGGEVDIEDLEGAVNAESWGGPIRLERIRNEVVARSAGGRIELGEIGSRAASYSAGGSIRARRIEGEAFFETAGGDIEVEYVKGYLRAQTAGGNIVVGRADSSVTANAAGGVIKLGEVAGEVVAQTAQGAIRIGSARGVRAVSSQGAIYLTGTSGPLHASTVAGEIVLRLAQDTNIEDSHLHTASGDITVYIPAGARLRLLASSTLNPRGGRIISEFPEIRVRLRGRQQDSNTLAEGVLNGGGALLRLSSDEGNIYLRRAH